MNFRRLFTTSLTTLSLCVRFSFSAAYYVAPSPNGSDNNAGTIDAPFQTLEKAQTAMRGSFTRTTYLKAGVYPRSATFILTVADSNTVWQTNPVDPVNSAIVDGQGIPDVIDILGGNNITIDGLTVRNYTSRAIGIHGGALWENANPYGNATYGVANGNTITNTIIENGIIPGNGWDRAGIYAMGAVRNTTIAHNLIRNTTGYGIGVWSCPVAGHDISNLDVRDNVLLNVFRNGTCYDGGAIYILDHPQVASGTKPLSTGIKVTNNFIRDYGDSTTGWGIYLDNYCSNAIVSGNIVSGDGARPVLLHGSKNVTITGNIFDVDTTQREVVQIVNMDSAMTGNSVLKNIVLSNRKTNRGVCFVNGSGTVLPFIKNNFYYNYQGPVCGLGTLGANDSLPIAGWPSMYGNTYTIDAQSSVYTAPINFTPLTRGWGPVGYTIPPSGTTPSCPSTFVAAPTVPIALAATASNECVELSWSPFFGATSYKVKRATTSGGPYATVFTVGTSIKNIDKSYIDNGLTNATNYYYVVSAVTAQGETSNSAEVSAKPLSGLPLYFRAGCADSSKGIYNWISYIGSCDNADWVSYKNIYLGSGYATLKANLGVPAQYAGKNVEMRLDSLTGTLVGTLTTTNTGDFNTFAIQTTNLTGATGKHDVYFSFQGGSGVGNFVWFQLETGTVATPITRPVRSQTAKSVAGPVFDLNGKLVTRVIDLRAIPTTVRCNGIYVVRPVSPSVGASSRQWLVVK